MNRSLALSQKARLVKQRNILSSSTALLAIICLGLVAFVCVSREKIIIVPARIEKSFWMQGSEFSPNYIEQMALYYLSFLLNKHRSNIRYNHEFVLRFAASSYYGELKKRLFKESKRLEEENLATTFYPKKTSVDPKSLVCEVTGLFQGRVGSAKVMEEEVTFILQFTLEGGIPMISQFKRKGEDK